MARKLHNGSPQSGAVSVQPASVSQRPDCELKQASRAGALNALPSVAHHQKADLERTGRSPSAVYRYRNLLSGSSYLPSQVPSTSKTELRI